MITDRQQIHRDYLCSPAWQAKRMQALELYGFICNRCGSFGTDVHHKNYDRVGGAEIMDDGGANAWQK